MEPIVLWNSKWGNDLYVPLYLFFGGFTGGLFIVAAVADLVGIKVERWQTVARVAAYAAVPSIIIAGLMITIHLGKPERGLAFPLFFTNYSSWMTLGGWIVAAAGSLVVLYAALWYFRAAILLRRIVAVVGIPVLAGLAVYTGLLLSGAMYVPLWSQKYLPLLFLNSGITTGVAGVGLVFLLAWPYIRAGESDDFVPVLRWLGIATIVVIVLELTELYQFMTFLNSPEGAAPQGRFVAPNGGPMAYIYVTGIGASETQKTLAPWFWFGIVGVGLTVPLLLALSEFVLPKWIRAIATTKFAMILVGGFVLRLVIVWGGELRAPLPFPPSNIPPMMGG